MNTKRFWELDFLRGTAIVLMIIFHFLWDLNYFKIIEIELYSGLSGLIQLTSAFLFLFIVGVVLTINYWSSKNYVKKFLTRGTTIFGTGLIITIVTIVFFPNKFIYFGILHLIGLSIIISILFVNKKKLNLILGMILLLIPKIINLQTIQTQIFFLGTGTIKPTLDYYPLIPWFGIILIGISFGNTFYSKLNPLIKIKKPKNKLISLIELIGKHSLLIYLIHQPIIFGTIYIITKLIY